MKTAFVVKKGNLFLVDSSIVTSDNYTEDIDDADVLFDEYEANDVVATGGSDGLIGERVVKITIETKEVVEEKEE